MKTEQRIVDLCDTFGVSRSGYYDWRQRQHEPGPRAREEEKLRAHVSAVHQRSRKTYGSPRIQKELRAEGSRHGRNRIGRVMRELGLVGRQKGRFRVVTTDSNHDLPIAPNHLAQTAPPSGPNQKWVGDITYIETQEGWLYLAVVMDLYSRRIVGWAMSDRIDTALVLLAWNMARTHRQPPRQILFHSDRGVQYASAEFRQQLRAAGAIASMSRKANCYDNAAMESFWSTLKLELVYRHQFATRAEARKEIFDYIETFYNPKRLHSSLGYCSPVDFENRHN